MSADYPWPREWDFEIADAADRVSTVFQRMGWTWPGDDLPTFPSPQDVRDKIVDLAELCWPAGSAAVGQVWVLVVTDTNGPALRIGVEVDTLGAPIR